MRYLMLICTEEKAVASLSDAERQAFTAEYVALQEDLRSRGVLLGAERLRPIADSTTVRVRDGEVLTADGPFAETKEQVAGFFLVDCKDLDEAVEIATRMPGARLGVIEVRPIWEL